MLRISGWYRCLVTGVLFSSLSFPTCHSCCTSIHLTALINRWIYKLKPKDNDNCSQKCQKPAFIVSGSLAISLSYPTDSGYPKSCKSHCTVGKENGASEISHQWLQGKGWFCFLRKKGENVLELSLKAKIQNIYETQKQESLQIISRTDASSIKANQ